MQYNPHSFLCLILWHCSVCVHMGFLNNFWFLFVWISICLFAVMEQQWKMQLIIVFRSTYSISLFLTELCALSMKTSRTECCTALNNQKYEYTLNIHIMFIKYIVWVLLLLLQWIDFNPYYRHNPHLTSMYPYIYLVLSILFLNVLPTETFHISLLALLPK